MKTHWVKTTFIAICFICFISFLFTAPLPGEDTKKSCLEFTQPMGPYTPGFKNVNHYDYTRTYAKKYDKRGNPVTEPARPIQTGIWYPAEKTKNQNAVPMTLQDYIDLTLFELAFPEVTEELIQKNRKEFNLLWGVSKEKMDELGVPTQAIRDAAPATGKFPLVIYAPSINSMSFENSVMCEYLASHGFIVAASPSFGQHTREMTQDPIGAEVQARDIEFLMGYMRHYPNVDHDKIAILSFSRGAMGNILTAMRDSRVDLSICLDGSVKFAYDVFQKSIFHNPKSITIPTVFFTSKPAPKEIMEKYKMPPWGEGFQLVDNMIYSDVHRLQFLKMTHQNYCSLFIQIYDRRPQLGEAPQKEVNESYNLVSRYVLAFMQAYLNQNAEAMKYVATSPETQGTAKLVRTKFNKGKTPPPDWGEFLFIAKQKGIVNIMNTYETIKKEHPDFQLNKSDLAEFGAVLSLENRFQEGIAVGDLSVKVFPDYIYSHYLLGEVYEKKGDKEKAIKAFQKVLELENGQDYLEIQKKIDELKK